MALRPISHDTTYVTDFVYLMHLPGGGIDVRSDRHLEGLFPRAAWLAGIEDAGFSASAVPLTSEGDEAAGREAFVARRPA